MKQTLTWALVMMTLVGGATVSAAEDTAEVRIERLERLVAQLQAQIDELHGERRQALAVATPAGEAVPSAQPTEPAPSETPTAAQTGPVSWSGEFRLYLDSLARATGAASAPLANTRGRYLFSVSTQVPVHRTLDLRARVSTGPANNPLTDIQDFGGGTAKHPISIAEAYVDYHPSSDVRLQAGRVDSPFNDRSRFLYDTDTRFNGASESISVPFRPGIAGISGVQFTAGQYIFTNPNVPVVAAGVPSTAASATPSQALLATGVEAGRAGPSSALFQQGVWVDQRLSPDITQRFATDLSLFRNPNQLQLLSEPAGAFLVSTSTGVTPSNPLPSLGNGTTSPEGGRFTAPGFNIVHGSYAFEHRALPGLGPGWPLVVNLQLARNLSAAFQNDAFMASVAVGQSTRGRARLAYAFYRKEANSLVAQLTENDIAISSSVNMAAHFVRVEYGFARNIVAASNVSITSFLSDSNPARGFFVPFGADTPSQSRYQFILVTRF